MHPMLPISYLGDHSLWREDVTWLADTLAQRTLAEVSERVRWLHIDLQPLASTGTRVVARVQIDVAGRDLISVLTIDRCAQAALCAAFREVRERTNDYEPIAI